MKRNMERDRIEHFEQVKSTRILANCGCIVYSLSSEISMQHANEWIDFEGQHKPYTIVSASRGDLRVMPLIAMLCIHIEGVHAWTA